MDLAARANQSSDGFPLLVIKEGSPASQSTANECGLRADLVTLEMVAYTMACITKPQGAVIVITSLPRAHQFAGIAERLF